MKNRVSVARESGARLFAAWLLKQPDGSLMSVDEGIARWIEDVSATKGIHHSDSACGKILEIMESSPFEEYEARDFSSLGKRQCVMSSLHRLYKSGEILRVSRGRYRLPAPPATGTEEGGA